MDNLYLAKEARIYNREKTNSSISGIGKTRQMHVKNKLRAFPNTIYKNKIKWIKDLNRGLETIKLIE